MRKLLAVALFTLLSACAVTGTVFGPSPEAQILNGANSVTAAATLGTALLKNGKITAAQARSYSNVLHSLSGHLDTANGTLVACRKSTGSTSKAVPDPCAAGIEADIRLVVSTVGGVQKALAAKQ